MKKRQTVVTIQFLSKNGPIFGNEYPDICIGDKCNEENSCYISPPSCFQYKYHYKYRSSLYVNTNGPDNSNFFSVLDYEVYGIDYESKGYVYDVCKHPDIMMEYIETNDISEESLRQFADDNELLNDLNTIHCKDTSIRLKTSRYYLKNRSRMLPDTQLVDIQYDVKFLEWLGNDYKWRLIYRASEHGYTAKSFHEYCDNMNGPTLVIIKSSEGWLFGGYTTQSWSGWSIYNDII